MTLWTVRAATKDDLPSIAAIRVRGWQEGYAGLLPAALLAAMAPEDDIARYRERFGTLGPEFAILVAEDPDGRLAGFANVGPYRLTDRNPEEAVLSDAEGEIYALYVDPARWRGGAGRALTAAAVGWLGARGRDPVRLWTFAANERARRFYEAAGFTADEHDRSFRIADTELPEVRYSLVRRRT